jgi:hypothetical protein
MKALCFLCRRAKLLSNGQRRLGKQARSDGDCFVEAHENATRRRAL